MYGVPNTGGSQTKSVASTLRSGFLQVSTDKTTAATGTNTANVGHVYGRLGQGAYTTPEAATVKVGFQWETPTADHALMLSLLPSDATAAAQTGTETITFKTSLTTFETNANIKPPTQPNAAVPPDPLSAIKLASWSVAAIGSVLFSTIN